MISLKKKVMCGGELDKTNLDVVGKADLDLACYGEVRRKQREDYPSIL